MDGEKLSVDEIVRQSNLLLIAGNSVKVLLDNPIQLQALRDDPSKINKAVEEMLRFDSPVTNSGRVANRDIDIGGCPVKKGESLSTALAAANRDPAIYTDPDKFDINRADTHHQSFGGGRHLCLGAHLCKSDKGHTYQSIPSFRGMSEFWVSAESVLAYLTVQHRKVQTLVLIVDQQSCQAELFQADIDRRFVANHLFEVRHIQISSKYRKRTIGWLTKTPD
jgi:hypothetical protein